MDIVDWKLSPALFFPKFSQEWVFTEDKPIPAQRKLELQRLIQKKFGFQDEQLHLHFENIKDKALSASAQAETLNVQMIEGLSVRFCSMMIINNAMRLGKTDGLWSYY